MQRIIRPNPALIAKLRSLPERQVLHGVERQDNGDSALQSHPGVAIIRKSFPYQSYFDSVAMERAILAQPPAQSIVPSTAVEENTPGWGIGLYPSSETPVAVQLLLGGNKSGSSTMILRPGEVYKASQKFQGVRYGLPFGWLGGGTAQIRIFQGKDDYSNFVATGAEVLFHRVRLPVFAITDVADITHRGGSPNWPVQFPWTNAFDFNNNPQKGQASLAIDPTKIVIRLRKSALASPSRMRLLITQSDDFDLQSDGVTYDAISVSTSWVDFEWPAIAASGFQIGASATVEFPLVTLDDNALRIGGQSATAFFLDMDGSILNTSFVDVERFGLI